jgi:hypothetical protein
MLLLLLAVLTLAPSPRPKNPQVPTKVTPPSLHHAPRSYEPAPTQSLETRNIPPQPTQHSAPSDLQHAPREVPEAPTPVPVRPAPTQLE